MAERWRDVLVFLLFVAVAASTYIAAQTTGTDEPLPMFLLALCVAAYLAYKVASWLLGKSAAASPRVEFSFPVYVLRDLAGRVLCTDEPNGGYLAVFTGPDPAERFREVRNVPEWSPAAYGHVELLDVLQSAKASGRVQYVMIDPLVGHHGFTPVFPLSHCLKRLSE